MTSVTSLLFNKVAFGVCLLLLLVSYATLVAAHRKGDQNQVRVLSFFRLGLSLSAISYLLRVTNSPHHSLPVFFSFVTCLLGTTFLWLGWMEHWRLRNERTNAHHVPREEEDEPVSETLLSPASAAGSSSLTAHSHQVLLHAQYEAHRRQDRCVDTDHLLLGMLCDPASAGVHILDALEVGTQKVHLELLGQMASCRRFTKLPRQTTDAAPRMKAKPLVLTDRADQVLALAAQEAHRFDKAFVGTEHLLLGLVLVGKGRAAEVLFAEGVTVDALRNEIIKAKKGVLTRDAMNRPRLVGR